MAPETLASFHALAMGFAVAGFLATGYQLATSRPASFRLLNSGPRPATFAAIPFLAFAAPFIIVRNTIRGRRIAKRRFEFAMMATMLAGLWSLLSGTAVVMALGSVGIHL
jgi:hypothetical protein